MNQFAEVNLLLLDSLKLISEEVKKQGMLSACPSKSLDVVYKFQSLEWETQHSWRMVEKPYQLDKYK